METLKITILVAIIVLLASAPYFLLIFAKFQTEKKEKRNGKKVPLLCVECVCWNRTVKNSEYGFCQKSKRKLPTHKNKKCIFN